MLLDTHHHLSVDQSISLKSFSSGKNIGGRHSEPQLFESVSLVFFYRTSTLAFFFFFKDFEYSIFPLKLCKKITFWCLFCGEAILTLLLCKQPTLSFKCLRGFFFSLNFESAEGYVVIYMLLCKDIVCIHIYLIILFSCSWHSIIFHMSFRCAA